MSLDLSRSGVLTNHKLCFKSVKLHAIVVSPFSMRWGDFTRPWAMGDLTMGHQVVELWGFTMKQAPHGSALEDLQGLATDEQCFSLWGYSLQYLGCLGATGRSQRLEICGEISSCPELERSWVGLKKNMSKSQVWQNWIHDDSWKFTEKPYDDAG